MGQSKSIVIVGAVAAGMSAATRLRRLDESAVITVVERGSEVSVATCGMPYHLGGVIADRDDLILQRPAALERRFGLDVRLQTTAIRIDRASKTLLVEGPGGRERIAYDELVLATGASPQRPGIPGDEKVVVLRGLADLDVIADRLERTRHAVVLGGGYVGLELAENLHRRGISTTLVQRSGQLLSGFDPEMVAPLADAVEAAGVVLRMPSHAIAVEGDVVVLEGGERIPADIVISAIGVRPESGLARAAGLALGATGGILVDDEFRTSDPSIRAIGDVAEKTDAVLGGTRSIPLAGPANLHGRRVADAIAGLPVTAPPTLGVAVVGAFGLTAAIAGASETLLRRHGVEHRVVHTHPLHHAGYYPGARPIALKLLIRASDDRILGVQAVGTEGVERRVDVIATAMRAGATASSLAELELAYAPQFGSAKDPVNMLGYVAENRRDGEASVQWYELDAELAAGARLIDVRTEGQLAEGAIPEARWIPVEDLRARADELRGDRVIVQCRVGQSAHTAVRLLMAHGIDAAILDGGYLTWRDGRRARDRAGEKSLVGRN